jgi:hypothetical protein
MFTHNQLIDTVQAGKKQIVSTFVTDAKFKEELNKLIDAQGQATKTAVEASLAIAQALVKNTSALFKMPTSN